MPRAEFGAVSASPKFFASQRKPKPPVRPPVKHDVPALVVPTRHEVIRMQSSSPRQAFITLPPVSARSATSASVGCADAPAVSRAFGGSAMAEPARHAQTARPDATPAAPVVLPKLTFSTTADIQLSSDAKAATARAFHDRLNDYVDSDDEDATRAATKQRNEISAFEVRHSSRVHTEPEQPQTDSIDSAHHTVTTIDEEASTRVLKVMFQLNLTRNSNIISRLKELDGSYLQRKLVHELGHKKQMSRDEFYVLMCKVLRDDYVNKRDCLTLFGVFDDDKSGLVDAVEFITGFMTLVSAGENDIAFKFIHTVLDSRGEKAIVNAFISRFELQLLVQAAQNHFAHDPEIVELLGELPNAFNFSHHLGRIPIMKLRDRIVNDEDLFAIFSVLPNPSRPAKEAVSSVDRPDAVDHTAEAEPQAQNLIIADQYINANQDLQANALEHDSPRWWVSGGIVYRCSESNPYPEPVFLKETDKIRR